MTPPKNVYFIRPKGKVGPIKIGCSMFPAKRMKEISLWSPLPLEVMAFVPGTHADERFLHRCFSTSHSHQEWFNASPELLAAIEKIAAAGTVDVIRDLFVPGGNIVRGPKLELTADQKKRRSYSHRIRWAEKRLGKRAPEPCVDIMSRWYGKERFRIPGVTPTPAEISTLEEYLAGSHGKSSRPVRESHPPSASAASRMVR